MSTTPSANTVKTPYTYAATQVVAHALLYLEDKKWQAASDEPLPLLVIAPEDTDETRYEITALALTSSPSFDDNTPVYTLHCHTNNPNIPVIHITSNTHEHSVFNIPPSLTTHPLLHLTASIQYGAIGYPETKQVPLHELSYTCSLTETLQLLQHHIPDLPKQAFSAWPHVLTLYMDVDWPAPDQPNKLFVVYEFSADHAANTLGFEVSTYSTSHPYPHCLTYSGLNSNYHQHAPHTLYTLRNHILLANLLPEPPPAATLYLQILNTNYRCTTYHPCLLLSQLDNLFLCYEALNQTPPHLATSYLPHDCSLQHALSTSYETPTPPVPLDLPRAYQLLLHNLCQQHCCQLSC